MRCAPAASLTAEMSLGASTTHAAATGGSCAREFAALIIARKADARMGSRKSFELTAIAVRAYAAAAAPNTSGADPLSAWAAASSIAASCQRNSDRVVADTNATSAAQPSRRTAEFR